MCLKNDKDEMPPPSSTASWPWLKSARLVTGEPIVEDENRPSVAKLLQEHRHSIAALQAALCNHPLFEPSKHDGLWLLRYILSHKGNVEKALKAAEHTLEFRKEHKLDEEDVRFQPISKTNPKTMQFLKHVDEGSFSYMVPNPERGVVAILLVGFMDFHALLEHLTDQQVETFFIAVSEWTHQWLDYSTRTTGRLTKSVRIVDAQGVSLHTINRVSMQRNAKYINAMEDVYPQLIQTVFPCNAPTMVHGLWHMVRPLLPQRLVAKIDFVHPEKRPQDLRKLLQHVDEHVLPRRYGGKNEQWPPSIPLPNVQ